MKRKKVCIAATIAVVVCAAAGTGYYFFIKQGSEPESPVLPEGMNLSEEVVSAAGLTSVGMLEEVCELGFLEDGLYVEETYLNMGDEVEAGTAVFRVSEDSLESARRELEKEVQETALNRRQGAIAYESGLLEAQKTLALAGVEADYAQAGYDNAVRTAQEQLDSLQEQVDEAQEKVDEYTASIEEDYYYTYYEVAEKEAAWKDNAAFLMELYELWDVAALEELYGGSGSGGGFGSLGSGGGSGSGGSSQNAVGYVTNQVTATSAGSGSGQNTGSGSSSAAAQGQSGVSGVSFSQESVTVGVYFTEETVTVALDDDSVDEEDESKDTESDTESDTEDENAEEDASDVEADSEEDDDGDDGTGGDSGTENESGSGSAGGETAERGGGMSGGMAVSGVADSALMAGGNSGISDDEIRYNIYLSMEEETQESETAYETALENYENARATAEAGIYEAVSSLAVLQAKLEEQKTSYEKALITAKLTYDLAISNQENAQMVYESAVKQLEEAYETLRDEEETAAENLELFEATIGDGTFYTSSDGSVMMTTVRAGQWITEDTVVIAYSNPDTVTIAAYVDQADIASVEIGQEAFVLVSGYGSYSGKVTSVNPVSSSGGSSVTYTVNVQLEGDISALEANLTAYVYLGLTEEEKEMMSGIGQSGKEDGGSWDEGGNVDGREGAPDGAGMSDGEMPDGRGMSGGGERSGGERSGGAGEPGGERSGGAGESGGMSGGAGFGGGQ